MSILVMLPEYYHTKLKQQATNNRISTLI